MTRNRIEGIGQSLDSLFQAKIGRRRLLRAGGLGAATIITAACFDGKVSDAVASTASEVVTADGKRMQVLIQPDLGTLGPDVDVVFGIDFPGDIPTDAEVIYSPGAGKVEETRVVGVKRTDLTYVQFKDALGGDAFDEWKNARFGGDEGLAARARFHAENSAHTHQKVVYIGDLGLFQQQWGEKPKEKAFLQRIIRAQRPSRLGIPDSNFVQTRKF